MTKLSFCFILYKKNVMNTIALVLLIFGIFSYYRIYSECKNKGIKFTPYETTPINTIGYSCGIASIIILIIHNIHLIF